MKKSRWRWGKAVLSLSVVLSIPVPALAASTPNSPALTLEASGIGPIHFGLAKAHAVDGLERALGRPDGTGYNTGCGPTFTEVAWRDLIVEFHRGVFTGYRYIDGGWPLTTRGSPSDSAKSTSPTPKLATAQGVTLGSTLGRVRMLYTGLKLVGAIKWAASNGIQFWESDSVRNPYAATDQIEQIQTGVCGAF